VRLSVRFSDYTFVTFSKYIKAGVEDVEPGHAVLYVDIEEIHLNGNGTLHGGVHSALIDNAMGLSVSSLVGCTERGGRLPPKGGSTTRKRT